jgi:hypothetical protein
MYKVLKGVYGMTKSNELRSVLNERVYEAREIPAMSEDDYNTLQGELEWLARDKALESLSLFDRGQVTGAVETLLKHFPRLTRISEDNRLDAQRFEESAREYEAHMDARHQNSYRQPR